MVASLGVIQLKPRLGSEPLSENLLAKTQQTEIILCVL
jgi:hypothetical protein